MPIPYQRPPWLLCYLIRRALCNMHVLLIGTGSCTAWHCIGKSKYRHRRALTDAWSRTSHVPAVGGADSFDFRRSHRIGCPSACSNLLAALPGGVALAAAAVAVAVPCSAIAGIAAPAACRAADCSAGTGLLPGGAVAAPMLLLRLSLLLPLEMVPSAASTSTSAEPVGCLGSTLLLTQCHADLRCSTAGCPVPCCSCCPPVPCCWCCTSPEPVLGACCPRPCTPAVGESCSADAAGPCAALATCCFCNSSTSASSWLRRCCMSLLPAAGASAPLLSATTAAAAGMPGAPCWCLETAASFSLSFFRAYRVAPPKHSFQSSEKG